MKIIKKHDFSPILMNLNVKDLVFDPHLSCDLYIFTFRFLFYMVFNHNHENMHRNVLILIHFVKKIRLAAGPLPGVALSGELASGGPLRGG